MITISGSAAWSTIQSIADGEAANSANFAVPAQALANRSEYLNTNKLNVSGGTINGALVVTGSVATPSISCGTVQLSGTTPVTLTTPRSVTRTVRTAMLTNPETKWSTVAQYSYTSVSSACLAAWELPVPNGSVITAVSAFTNGSVGHGGLPDTMPWINLYTTTLSSGAYTSVSAADSSASVSAYEAVHAIAITGLATLVDRTAKIYTVELRTESGTNALSAQSVYGVAYTMTLSAMDQAAG